MRKYRDALRHVKIGILLFPLIVILASCSSDPPPAPQPTARDDAEAGWAKFAADDYAGAQTEFDRAIAKDAAYADGYLGAGWVALYLNDAPAAGTHFASGKTKTSDTALQCDFHAGLTLAWSEIADYDRTIAATDSCLDYAPQYSFSRRSTINYVDLLAAQANAYFLLGGDANLAQAAHIVHQIIPAVDLDPGNSTTWVVDGESYTTFSAALVRALERASQVASSG